MFKGYSQQQSYPVWRELCQRPVWPDAWWRRVDCQGRRLAQYCGESATTISHSDPQIGKKKTLKWNRYHQVIRESLNVRFVFLRTTGKVIIDPERFVLISYYLKVIMDVTVTWQCSSSYTDSSPTCWWRRGRPPHSAWRSAGTYTSKKLSF